MLQRIDLHVVWMLIFIVPLSAIVLPSFWILLPILLIPQGRLLTHYSDQARSGHRADGFRYFAANELLLCTIALTIVAVLLLWP